ncbi:T-box transcription factor mls-1-like [Macrosteles quadrilineatus]|uniref:T-box transcription factor mls-1-like n=1 Tax=Macrosteles quadrilineatus TaxID=74068 RepID=UPI0023E0BB77|nr:T-box transcription factor mls-1-like [Macrosteles quadrilineatus]XP_054258776.1 T-box transcription factor mls-1-like [Macrosteles quadrilineatus]
MASEEITPTSSHPALESVTMTLHKADLWRQFHQHGTEMIITKTGRRMFPYLRLQVNGLNPNARYFLVLELAPASEFRYKFSSGGSWMTVGTAEPQMPSSARVYIHPDSPATAAHWSGQQVLFNRVKLTNNNLDRSGNIVLNSMHKYVPTVHVIMATDVLALHWSPRATFVFPTTEFMAVTAYQNEKVTKLKIDNNPFAKGFREGGDGVFRSKKRKAEQQAKEDERLKKTCAKQELERSTDDSGVSSMGSPTPPTTTTPVTSQLDRYSPQLPPRFMIPDMNPYFHPSLWHYPYFLPPPPPLFHSPYYAHLLPPLTPNIEPYESFLMDLRVKKETITITNQ